MEDWYNHWSVENQDNAAQKFFSFYRKAVFSRTVSHFIKRYFPPEGIFIEAGSGTSETSIRINKMNGKRMLVAVDIILPVLNKNHPIMDIKLCGDVFQLPFPDASIDGIWNVGVMEHFTHYQIDQILVEFYRVLKKNAPMILLWPATYSVPQRVLRLVEIVLNLKYISHHRGDHHFHPAEISQLKSISEGAEILSRNGIRVLEADYGWKSMLAFITLVGEKI